MRFILCIEQRGFAFTLVLLVGNPHFQGTVRTKRHGLSFPLPRGPSNRIGQQTFHPNRLHPLFLSIHKLRRFSKQPLVVEFPQSLRVVVLAFTFTQQHPPIVVTLPHPHRHTILKASFTGHCPILMLELNPVTFLRPHGLSTPYNENEFF